MYRQPNRRLIGCGPLDPVLFVCWNVQPISRPHLNRLFVALEPEPSFALNHHNPLVFVLVVPKAIGRSMAVRNDSLDADVGCIDERLDQFFQQALGNIGEKVKRQDY